MASSLLDSEAQFTFRQRPLPLVAPMRAQWRIAVLCLTLKKCCRQSRSSLFRLHVLNWAVRTREAQKALLAVVEGRLSPEQMLVRFDPTLVVAIDYAIGERLILPQRNARYQLALEGQLLVAEVESDTSCLAFERRFLDRVGFNFTEAVADTARRRRART